MIDRGFMKKFSITKKIFLLRNQKFEKWSSNFPNYFPINTEIVINKKKCLKYLMFYICLTIV